MKQEQNEQVKRNEWVSLVVDVAVCKPFYGIHRSSVLKGSLAPFAHLPR